MGGLFFPLVMLWVWEERFRARELRAWRRQLTAQRLQRQQEQQQLGGDGEASASLPPSPASPRECPGGDLPRPLAVTLAWFAASSWGMWLLIDAAFL